MDDSSVYLALISTLCFCLSVPYPVYASLHHEHSFYSNKNDGNNMKFFLIGWTVVVGHVDPGENDLETAFRETEEEAGLTRDQLLVMEKFKKIQNYDAFGKPKRVVYWLSELKDPQTPVVLSSEHRDYKWAEMEEAVKLVGFQNLQELIKEAQQFLTVL